MDEQRFQTLRGALLEAGITKSGARRAASEIEDHFHQLVGEALARGTGEQQARQEAHATLGSNEILVRRYAARRELLGWPSRWPALWFTIVPLGCYLALSIAVMTALVLGLGQMSAYLHHVKVPPHVSSLIDLAVCVIFLGLFPASVAAAFGVFARRRRIPLRWPVMGVAAMSILAALINIEFTITGGPSPGSAGAGIGVSAHSLPAQTLRALAVGSLALLPLGIAAHRAKRDTGREMI